MEPIDQLFELILIPPFSSINCTSWVTTVCLKVLCVDDVSIQQNYNYFTRHCDGCTCLRPVYAKIAYEYIPSIMQEHIHIAGLRWKFLSFGLYIMNQYWWINIIRQRLCLIWSLLFSRIHHHGKAICSVMGGRSCGTWGSFLLLISSTYIQKPSYNWLLSFSIFTGDLLRLP